MHPNLIQPVQSSKTHFSGVHASVIQPLSPRPAATSARLRSIDATAASDKLRTYDNEAKYLSKLVLVILFAVVLPAIAVLLYIVLNPEAFQPPLIP